MKFVPGVSALRRADPWHRNLVFLWLAQMIATMGFSFIFPFVPLFIQELGIHEAGRAAFWSGIAAGASGVVMMVAGPVWGVLGDRYGRKKNVVRAMVGSAIALAATAAVVDVYQFVGTRVVLGMVSGVWSPMFALAASMAPRGRASFSVGVLLSAAFLGNSVGPYMGGLLAESVGYRMTFLITGGLEAVAALLVLLFVTERFERPADIGRLGLHLLWSNFDRLLRSRGMVAVLLVVLMLESGTTLMIPVLPVLIGALVGAGTAASSAGLAFSVRGITATAASLAMGKVTERFGTTGVLVVAASLGAVAYLPLLVVDGLPEIYVTLAFLGLFLGGASTLGYALVGASASREQQGVAYGVAQSAMAMSWGAGPAIGGAIAAFVGLRPVFLACSLSLVISAVLAARVLRPDRPREDGDTAVVEVAPGPGPAAERRSA